VFSPFSSASAAPAARQEVRNVRLLAAIAAVSLETMWEIEEVTRRARTDQLTGLANRRHFDEQIARVLAETDRFGGSASLVVADIDYFNVRAIRRRGDRGPPAADEHGRARDFAERLRKGDRIGVVAHGGRDISVTALFGVATYPDSVASRDGLFPAADRALYQAKAEGRNRFGARSPGPSREQRRGCTSPRFEV
jgi:PleD family two-component response regulator